MSPLSSTLGQDMITFRSPLFPCSAPSLCLSVKSGLTGSAHHAEVFVRHRHRRLTWRLVTLAIGRQVKCSVSDDSSGTVVANMVGGYIIGFAIAFLAASPSLSPEWRLLIITGFCGGLTTFSTFSAETVVLIQEGRLLWALGSISLHVLGSLAMTAAGLLSYQMIGAR